MPKRRGDNLWHLQKLSLLTIFLTPPRIIYKINFKCVYSIFIFYNMIITYENNFVKVFINIFDMKFVKPLDFFLRFCYTDTVISKLSAVTKNTRVLFFSESRVWCDPGKNMCAFRLPSCGLYRMRLIFFSEFGWHHEYLVPIYREGTFLISLPKISFLKG